MKSSEEELLEKVRKVDELRRKHGWGMDKCCKKVGIPTSVYLKLKRGNSGGVDKDPVVREASSPDKSEGVNEGSVNKGGGEVDKKRELDNMAKRLENVASEISEVDARLREYIGSQYDHPLLRKVAELKSEISATEHALRQAYVMLGLNFGGAPAKPGAPQVAQPPAQPQEVVVKPEDALESLKRDVETLEEKRRRLRETLEALGFKVLDLFMRRDEVEKLLEEERKKWEEEALDDRRIQAVENIINRAVDRVTDMFKPVIDAWVQNLLMGRGQPSTQDTQSGSRPSSASES